MDKITKIVAELKAKIAEFDEAVTEELQSRPAKVKDTVAVEAPETPETAPTDVPVAEVVSEPVIEAPVVPTPETVEPVISPTE